MSRKKKQVASSVPARDIQQAPRAPMAAWTAQFPRLTVRYSEAVEATHALNHPVLFRLLNKIASSVQSVRWFAEPDPNFKGPKPSESVMQAINNLLSSPNDVMTPAQLRYWMALNFACYGRIPFKVGTDINKIPNAIYPLEARFVSAVTDVRGFVTQYEYGPEEGKRSDQNKRMNTRQQAIRTNSESAGWATEIYIPNISGLFALNPLDGMTHGASPLHSIGLPTEVIKLLLQRALDSASGVPNKKHIVTAEKNLTKKQENAIKDHIADSTPGGEEAGSILFLYNTAIKVETLDNDLSDIHSKIPLDDMTRLITGAFGIPVPLLGLNAADGAKFAGNYAEALLSYWNDTIIPMYLQPIAEGVTAAIAPPGIRVSFDYDSIGALEAERAAKANSLQNVTFLTVTEKRELLGYAPLTEEQKKEIQEAAKQSSPQQAIKPQPSPNTVDNQVK